jgi:hypothetical protein
VPTIERIGSRLRGGDGEDLFTRAEAGTVRSSGIIFAQFAIAGGDAVVGVPR